MPDSGSHLLPGTKGQDYHFVRSGDQVYVVYSMQLPGSGRTMRIAYRIGQNELKAYGIDSPGQIQSIPKAAAQGLNVLGNASEIILRGDEHPWTQYLKHLRELNGNVSWLQNREFMQTMLEGFFEGWDQTELQQALTQTDWYQNRTATQRQWVTMADADKEAATKGIQSQLQEQLRTLYGPDFRLEDTSLTPKELKKAAAKIASGTWGTPEEGLSLWIQRQRNQAEKVEGTPAWIDREQQLEQQRAFMNRPEDMLKQLQDQAYQWLGPSGVPDKGTLQRWADRLVAQNASQADWENFLQGQAKSLYPWLGTNETWQDRASAYKNIVEQNIGAGISWDDPLLRDLGGRDANGSGTGDALSFSDFTSKVRNDGRFWAGPVAKQETYGLSNRINQLFTGASS